jgi:hypothetical protein
VSALACLAKALRLEADKDITLSGYGAALDRRKADLRLAADRIEKALAADAATLRKIQLDNEWCQECAVAGEAGALTTFVAGLEGK